MKFKKGIIPWNKGKKMSVEDMQKIMDTAEELVNKLTGKKYEKLYKKHNRIV